MTGFSARSTSIAIVDDAIYHFCAFAQPGMRSLTNDTGQYRPIENVWCITKDGWTANKISSN